MRVCISHIWRCLMPIAILLAFAPATSFADEVTVTTPYGSATMYPLGPGDPNACLSEHPDAALCQLFMNSNSATADANTQLVLTWLARQMCDRFNDIPACILDTASIFRVGPAAPYQAQEIINLGIGRCNPIIDSPSQVGVSMGLACHELGDYLIRHGQERL